ncbi:tetratricopeptide repeat protein [Roseateles sp. BYS87W]|uniref:Tetratricopeptide repeat protein n=1 Tax=Pelomonas baiyunensis TaxID=3299026 RepID=A0ABW7GTH1_9BURK
MTWWRRVWVSLGLAAMLGWGAAQALPQVDEVQAAVQRGDYAGAEKMMREVVAAKPDSARAHYVLAEILAHERQFKAAADHASRARALDPAIKFTDPGKFTAFEQLLERQQAATATPAPAVQGATAPPARVIPREPEPAHGGGVPVWLLVVGGVVFIALAVRWMARRAAVPAPVPMASGGYSPAGYGAGGYGASPAGWGPAAAPPSGPGLMGVGLAAAGGVAAGMLAEKLLHGDADERRRTRDVDAGAGMGAGGIIPGSFDGGGNSAADDLTRRGIDFGSGDGWDSGSSGGGDFSGGDSGGGGGDW